MLTEDVDKLIPALKLRAIPKRTVKAANIPTNLENLGMNFTISSILAGGERLGIKGPMTNVKKRAEPIQPIDESMWSQAKIMLTSLAAKAVFVAVFNI